MAVGDQAGRQSRVGQLRPQNILMAVYLGRTAITEVRAEPYGVDRRVNLLGCRTGVTNCNPYTGSDRTGDELRRVVPFRSDRQQAGCAPRQLVVAL